MAKHYPPPHAQPAARISLHQHPHQHKHQMQQGCLPDAAEAIPAVVSS